MEKGKCGVRLCFFTVTSFVLAYLGQTMLLFLLAGAVIFVEKDEWAGRQVMQAICLWFLNAVVGAVLGLFDFVYNIPIIGRIWSVVDGFIGGAVSLVVLVFCVVGILKNIKGQDADIIGAKKFADWAYGIAKEKKEPQTETPQQ